MDFATHNVGLIPRLWRCRSHNKTLHLPFTSPERRIKGSPLPPAAELGLELRPVRGSSVTQLKTGFIHCNLGRV